MVNINMKKLADNSRWISHEFRELSASYVWWGNNKKLWCIRQSLLNG